MTMTKATKVAKRAWSFERFTQSVSNKAKRLNVSLKGKAGRMRGCYERSLTVRDTVNVLQGS